MEVKLVARTLDVIALFSQECRPLSLTEISSALDIPMSSCLALVRTLAVKGYVYEVRKRGGYYPTRKLLTQCLKISTSDVLLDLCEPVLNELRDQSGESVVLGKRMDACVIYLACIPSSNPIRYSIDVGDSRPLQSNALGKILFAMEDPSEKQKIMEQITWQKFTEHTIADRDSFLQLSEQWAQQGWAANEGEKVADLASIAVPFRYGTDWYSFAIAGPIDRIKAQWESQLRLVQGAKEKLDSILES